MKDFLFQIDWERLFVPSLSIAEALIRGTVVYVVLLLLLHVLRKQSGSFSISDFLLVVVLGSAAQNAIVGDTVSITDGVLLASIIIFWNVVFDYLSFKSARFRKFIHPPPRLLMENGKIILKNMERECITNEELQSQIREQGIENFSEVKKAYLEGDGHLSVIRNAGHKN